jgi:hypothetical protein
MPRSLLKLDLIVAALSVLLIGAVARSIRRL